MSSTYSNFFMMCSPTLITEYQVGRERKKVWEKRTSMSDTMFFLKRSDFSINWHCCYLSFVKLFPSIFSCVSCVIISSCRTLSNTLAQIYLFLYFQSSFNYSSKNVDCISCTFFLHKVTLFLCYLWFNFFPDS